MKEITKASKICEREYALYPEPGVKKLVVALYTESLSGMQKIFTVLTRNPTRSRLPQIAESELQRTVKKVKEFSENVIREVEYLHRRELREARLRLREVDWKQNEVMKAIEERRRILVSI